MITGWLAGWLAGYDNAPANCGRRTWPSPARSVVSPPDRWVRLALSGILPGRGGQRHIREEDCFMILLFLIIKLNNTPGSNEKWLTLAEGLAIHHVGRERGGGGRRQPRPGQIAQNASTMAAASIRPAGSHKPEGHRISIHPCPTGVATTLRRQQLCHIRSNVLQRGALNPRDDEPAIPRSTRSAPPRSPVAAGVEPPSHPRVRGWKQKKTPKRPSPGRSDACWAGSSGMRTARWDVGLDTDDSRAVLRG